MPRIKAGLDAYGDVEHIWRGALNHEGVIFTCQDEKTAIAVLARLNQYRTLDRQAREDKPQGTYLDRFKVSRKGEHIIIEPRLVSGSMSTLDGRKIEHVVSGSPVVSGSQGGSSPDLNFDAPLNLDKE